jgi:polysaccharide export outer membrane protein
VKKIILSLALVVLLTGCNAFQKIVYVQNAGTAISYTDSTKAVATDSKIKLGDLLIINVSSITPEAAQPFNLSSNAGAVSLPGTTSVSASGSSAVSDYLVDNAGDINFPILGKIHVLGMTKTDLSNSLKSKIYPFYIKDEPIITIRYSNFKVSVLGEVARPGLCEIKNERVNILEVIAMAGDLTIYGQRDNVLLVREKANGQRESVRIDLRDKRLIDSPYYYLQQNDVLYIQPNNPKARSTFFGTAESTSIGLISTLFSFTSLIVTLTK